MHPFFKHIQDHVSARHAAHHERHAARHAAHHAAGGRGFGGFRFDFGGGFPGEGRGGGPGGRGMGPGRKLGSADLQLLILALLAEKPRHGYEIIKALDERSNGFYSPSPGMVYPALTYLEEIGHATVAAEGAKKLYSITDTGLAHLEQNRTAVDTLLEQLAFIGKKMDSVRRAMSGHAEEGEDGEGVDDLDERRGHHGWHRMSAPLRQARRSIKSALIEKYGASAEEQARVAEVLERAAAEIRGW
ncbi:MAG: PadR family transcriptional regulator [Pseudomonadota bacterium]